MKWPALEKLNMEMKHGGGGLFLKLAVHDFKMQQDAALRAIARGSTIQFHPAIRQGEAAAHSTPRHRKTGRHIVMDDGSTPRMEYTKMPQAGSGEWENAARAFEESR